MRPCWENVATDAATLRVADSRRVVADRSRLQQLLENLFRNALEHGARDGEAGAFTVTVGTCESGFYVEDDGSGIPAADRESVLEAGFTTEREGTGFGLNIVAEIASAHGWDLAVAESDAGGARFEFLAEPV